MVKYHHASAPLRYAEYTILKELASRNGVALSELVRQALAATYGPDLVALARELNLSSRELKL
jgi:hypothetical protein